MNREKYVFARMFELFNLKISLFSNGNLEMG
jgi:hypothetical protein